MNTGTSEVSLAEQVIIYGHPHWASYIDIPETERDKYFLLEDGGYVFKEAGEIYQNAKKKSMGQECLMSRGLNKIGVPFNTEGIRARASAIIRTASKYEIQVIDSTKSLENFLNQFPLEIQELLKTCKFNGKKTSNYNGEFECSSIGIDQAIDSARYVGADFSYNDDEMICELQYIDPNIIANVSGMTNGWGDATPYVKIIYNNKEFKLKLFNNMFI